MGVWMLDIAAGPTWRFATRPVDWNGDRYHHGLVTSGEALSALSFDAPEEVSHSFTVYAQHVADFDAESVALGAVGTLRYWEDPDGSDDPITVAVGTIEDPIFGGPDEPLGATLRDSPWLDRGLIPDAAAFVSADTWANFDTDANIDAEFYPLVIGEPGEYTTSTPDAYGSPALYVDTTGGSELMMVAGHPVVGTSIWLNNTTQGTQTTASVSTQADDLGRPVAVADVSAWVTASGLAAGDEVWATWYLAGHGGLPLPSDPSVALTGAGDLIEYLLHRSTIRVDWGRLRAAKQHLNTFRVDTYIQGLPEQRVSPWGWISEHLLPLLPVSVRTGPEGLYLAAFDPSRPVERGVERMEEGRNCDRISPVAAVGTEDVANSFELRYAPKSDRDKGFSVARVSGDRTLLDAFSGAIRSPVCEESVRRFGVRSRQMSTTAIYDDSTATRLLLAMAARTALPPLEVAYQMRRPTDLEPGDQVRLVDDSLGWGARTAYVWSVRTGTPTEVTLRLWRIPGRDSAP